MNQVSFDKLAQEFSFVTSRSSGAGGQNVNKVNTKVTLRFDVEGSAHLTQDQKDLIRARLATRITKDGILTLSSETSRSQMENKENVINTFEVLIRRALTPRKKRKATKPTKTSVEKRISNKKKLSEKKKNRRADLD